MKERNRVAGVDREEKSNKAGNGDKMIVRGQTGCQRDGKSIVSVSCCLRDPICQLGQISGDVVVCLAQ